MSVLENVLLPAYPLGLPYRDMASRARSLLGRFRLEDKAHRLPETLSGGEKQRVAIARALMNSPSILIADEPTAQLDSELSMAFMDMALELNQEGMTLLIASHDQLVSEAPGVHRVLSIRDGIIEKGA